MRRSSRAQRSVAWLAVVAVLLIALAPTMSRLRAAWPAHPGEHAHAMAMAPGVPCDPASPGDPSRACGYCDFLTHAPAVGSVDYVAPSLAFDAGLLDRVPRAAPPPRAAYALAARPRGPPALSRS